MKIGGINITGGKLETIVLDTIPTAPTFDSVQAGEFTFSDDDKILRFNTGSALVALNSGVSENPNLITSLGSNWLNSDLTFNPTPFNSLPGIAGLKPSDSLFVVVDQLSSLIDNLSNVELGDITVPVNPYMQLIVTLDGAVFTMELDRVINSSSINLDFNTLSDFDITPGDMIDGNQLVFNDQAKLVSKKVHYTYENLASSQEHLITHGFGNQYCSVFCINPHSGKAVTPSDIIYGEDNQVIVKFDQYTDGIPLLAILTNIYS
jgi:hypothetical protein